MFDSILAIFKASLKDPHIGPSQRRRSSVRPMNVKNGKRCNDCQIIQMENQKLRSKVAQLEVQIAEMKSKMKNGTYSGKCSYEIGASNGDHVTREHNNNGLTNGRDIRPRQSNLSSSLRMSSTSMHSKPKLSKVESSPLPGTRARITSNKESQPHQQDALSNRKSTVVPRQSFRTSQNPISRDSLPNRSLNLSQGEPREGDRIRAAPKVIIPETKIHQRTTSSSGQKKWPLNGQSSESPSPTEAIRASYFARRRSSSVDNIPLMPKTTPFSRGSTITRTVISKGGEERRDAFRKSTSSQRKSSSEKLAEILKVNRSSKGPTVARLAMRRSSSTTNIHNAAVNFFQVKQNSVTAGPFQLLK